MIHVNLSIPVAGIHVGSAVIPGCSASGDPQGSSGGERLVMRVAALLVRRGLRATPTDGNHAGLAMRVMYRRTDRIEKAFVSIVGSEIHGDLRSRCHSPSHFH